VARWPGESGREQVHLCRLGVPQSTIEQQGEFVITCVIDYVIDPSKTEDFEHFARRWVELVERHGGVHHGYYLPSEGASDRALALFSFPSLAAYEQYRSLFGRDPEFIESDRIRDESECVVRYDRTFMRPLQP